MQIKQHTQHPYTKAATPTFGWVRICRANVIQRGVKEGKRFIPVDVCLLEKSDLSFVENLATRWAPKHSHTLRSAIINRFIKEVKEGIVPSPKAECGRNYLMVMPTEPIEVTPKIAFKKKFKALIAGIFNRPMPELPQPRKIENEPLCLAQMERDGDSFDLTMLHAHRDIIKQSSSKRVSGSGQLQVYGVAKIIDALNGKELEFLSINDKFYKKIFKKSTKLRNGLFTIRGYGLRKFMKETEKLHKIQEESIISDYDLVTELRKNTFLS